MKNTTIQLLCCALLANLAFAANPKISKDLAAAATQSTGEVIVQFAHPPTEAHHNMVRNHGGSFRSELPLVKSGVYSIPVSALESLASEPEVVYISPNRSLRGSIDNVAAGVNASAAWNIGLTGAGIGVALIDSGVAMGQDLTGSTIEYGGSWSGYTTQDAYGHGTHVELRLYTQPPGPRNGGENRQLSGTGSERQRHRRQRDCRDRCGDRSEVHLQHPGHELVFGAPGV
jgi:hypothetical protein